MKHQSGYAQKGSRVGHSMGRWMVAVLLASGLAGAWSEGLLHANTNDGDPPPVPCPEQQCPPCEGEGGAGASQASGPMSYKDGGVHERVPSLSSSKGKGGGSPPPSPSRTAHFLPSKGFEPIRGMTTSGPKPPSAPQRKGYWMPPPSAWPRYEAKSGSLSYDSKLLTSTGVEPRGRQGYRWKAERITTNLLQRVDGVSYVRNASSRRDFVEDEGSYTGPSDYTATLSEDSENDRYELKVTWGGGGVRSKKRFADFSVAWGSLQKGQLVSEEDAYGNETDYSYDGGGQVETVTLDNAWTADYTYCDGLSNDGRIRSVVTRKPVGEEDYETVEGVIYFYMGDDVGWSSHCGTTGDLVLVLNCEGLEGTGEAEYGSNTTTLVHSDSSFADDAVVGCKLVMVDGDNVARIRTITDSTSTSITVDAYAQSIGLGDTYFVVRGPIKATHYRYYDDDSDGQEHQMKHVFECAAVDRTIAGNENLDEPADVLEEDDDFAVSGTTTLAEYSSRSFIYYTSTQSTSSVDTPWGGDAENLNGKYGGSSPTEVTEYTSPAGMVKSETVRGDCAGCGGGGATGLTHTYFYLDINGGPDETEGDNDEVRRITVEDITAGETKVRRVIRGLNKHGVWLRKVTVVNVGSEETPDLEYWCESRIVGTTTAEYNKIKEHRMPSAHVDVDTDGEVEQFLDPTTSTNDSGTLEDDDGVIYLTEYNANGLETYTKIQQGENGTPILLTYKQYTSIGTPAVYLLTSETTYTEDDGTGGVETTYSYDSDGENGLTLADFWDNDPSRPKTVITTYPAASTGKNGSGATTSSRVYYDDKGRLRWSKSPSGVVTYYAPHPETGGVGYQMVDVETDDLPGAITSGSEGKWLAWSGGIPEGFANTADDALQLVSKTEYDDMGWVVKEEDPAGVVTYTVYDGNTTLVFPAWDDGEDEPVLPIQITVTDSSGTALETYTVDPDRTDDDSGVPVGLLSGTTSTYYLSWTEYNHDYQGRLTSREDYYDISGDKELTTTYGYDDLGRQWMTESPDGTIRLTVRDKLDRVIEQWIGKDATGAAWNDPEGTDTNNMVQIAATFYDESTAGSGTSGVGDGLVTSQRSVYGSGTSYYQTRYCYDWRGRIVQTRKPGKITTKRTLDNLGRATQVEAYVDASDPEDWTLDSGELRARMDLAYDEAGRTYEQTTYRVASGTLSETDELITDTWYDDEGRVIKQSDANGMSQKTQYDSLGRVTVSYLCYDSDDTDTEGGSAYAGAGSITGDVVIEQTQYQYDIYGNAWLTVAWRRNHDTTGTGDLSWASAPKGQAAYTVEWYDDIGRVTHRAFYGHNDKTDITGVSSDFDPSGSTQTYSQYADDITPDCSDKILVTEFAYDADSGRMDEVMDNAGKETRSESDALGRTTETIENYVNGTAGTTDYACDRTTVYDYDAKGRLARITAKSPTGSSVVDQETYYIYGDSLNGGLVTEIVYSDTDDTVGGGVATEFSITDDQGDHVAVAYDHLGRRTALTDQRGTERQFVYNTDGRLIEERATTILGNVDDSIQRIELDYDDLGRVETVSSYDADENGTLLNQVLMEYDGWGNVTEVWQDHDSVVDDDGQGEDSPVVSYTYDDGASGGVGEYLRQQNIVYPNGDTFHFSYGTSGGIDDRLSREAAIKAGTAASPGDSVVEYSYLGAGRIVIKDYPTPDLKLDYFGDTPGTYAGLDRFGRVIQQHWIDYAPATDVDVFKIAHGYDEASNRLYAERDVYGGYSHYYTYDGLHRLDKFGRGTLNSTEDDTTGYPTYRERDWSLDVLGNWMDVDDYGELAAPTGDYFQRSHNYANEITSLEVSADGAPRSIVDEFTIDTKSNYEVIDGSSTDLNINTVTKMLNAVSLKSTRDSVDYTIALTPAGADFSRSGCGSVSTKVTLPVDSPKAGIVFGYRDVDDFWLFVADEAGDEVQLYHVTSTAYAPTHSSYLVQGEGRNIDTGGETLSFQCRSGRFISGDGLLDVELSGGVPAGKIGLYTETTSATFDYLHAREAETFTDVLGRWDCAAADVSIESGQLEMVSSADEPYDCPILRKGLRLEEHQVTFDLNTTSTSGAVRYVFYVQDTNNYHFVEIPWNDNTQQTCTLGKVVDGGQVVSLATGNITLDDATTYEVRITVEGQDVKVEYDDSGWATVFDTSGSDYLPSDSGGRLGFAITSGTARLDDVAVMTDPAGGTSFVDSQMATEDFASGTVSPTYDDAGNLTSDGVRGYVYDAWNRLVEVTRDGSDVHQTSEEVVVATLTYDGLGRRISKQITNSADHNATLHYYYDGDSLVETCDGSDSTLQRYVWGVGYVDELVQVGQGISGGSTIVQEFYVMQDANYNVLGVATDYGRLVERYEYTPYGRRAVFSHGWLLADANDDGVVDTGDQTLYQASDSSADFNGDGTVDTDDGDILTACLGNSLPDGDTDPLVTRPTLGSFRHAMSGVGSCEVGHQGLLHDEELDLVYNRSRMHDPGTGRLMQRDPGAADVVRNLAGGTMSPAGYSPHGASGIKQYPSVFLPIPVTLAVRTPDYSLLLAQLGAAEALMPFTVQSQFQDGPNLYQRVRSSPVGYLDPTGLAAKHSIRDCPDRRTNGKPPPAPNGCGPEGGPEILQIGSVDFTSACNTHDSCYATCNSDRNACDLALWNDTSEMCNNQRNSLSWWRKLAYGNEDWLGCQALAGAYLLAVDTWGEDPYWAAQENVCECRCK
jgi:YD repeat-containing protein